MKFKLTIDIAGAALTDDLPDELCCILDRVCMQITDQVPQHASVEKGMEHGLFPAPCVVRDTNGNTVGRWEITA